MNVNQLEYIETLSKIQAVDSENITPAKLQMPISINWVLTKAGAELNLTWYPTIKVTKSIKALVVPIMYLLYVSVFSL